MVVVALVASAATLITAGVEWLLWKAYIIAIIEWILYYFIYKVFELPI